MGIDESFSEAARQQSRNGADLKGLRTRVFELEHRVSDLEQSIWPALDRVIHLLGQVTELLDEISDEEEDHGLYETNH
jgi:hypothetical protein